MSRLAILICLLLAACGSSTPMQSRSVAHADLLSADTTSAPIAADRGNGIFGHWSVDAFGLPAYDYTLDQVNDPHAPRVELNGTRSHWSQLGNDATIANAYNDGYVQLWSQARLAQWVNEYNEAGRQYAGGYGYLNVDGQVYSTLWLDRPQGSEPLRRFGVGYFARKLDVAGIAIEEAVTSPWGDSPALAHEITLRNNSSATKSVSWWEFWGVNPEDRTTRRWIGLNQPQFDATHATLSVGQLVDGSDTDPLTIFLAAVDAPIDGFETNLDTFFGSGTRAAPAAVVADAPSDSIALPFAGNNNLLPPGHTALALRSPVQIPPGGSVRLRYVYGIAHAAAINGVVDAIRAQDDTQRATAQAWRAWLPQADLGSGREWLNRELQWDAYMVRSSSMWEEACGHHVITQGGYYQYGTGFQIAFRDPLQHMLPIVYADHELAREVLRYSFQEQPPETGAIAYGTAPLCIRYDLGTSNDLDFWLMWSAVEYILASRDLGFLDEPLPFRGGLPGPALEGGTMWDHIKLAYHHQEDLTPRGPNGHYVIGITGDWSDISTEFMQMTESVLVTAQLAWLYPRLADVAELRGDRQFAATVRARAAELIDKLRDEWTGLGWYSRGYSGLRQLGQGAIFAEPQPWALLAGAPDAMQTATLVGNIRRFLTGVDAPAAINGPAKIGSSQSPAANDPDVTETDLLTGVGDNNAVYVGGVWYSLNGPLVWALGNLDGSLPNAADFALDELERNTLAAHADAYPEYWDGVVNVDDACWSFYSSDPGRCAVDSLVKLGSYAGQITHKHAWTLFSTLKLAGVEPTREGYRIAPHLPMAQWSIRLPNIGVAQNEHSLRGYLRAASDAPVTLEVHPRNLAGRELRVRVNGEPIAADAIDGGVRFTVHTQKEQPVDWVVEPQ